MTPPPTGTLSFAAGGTPTTVRTRTFTIPILNDTLVEGIETVNLTLSAPAGGAALVTGAIPPCCRSARTTWPGSSSSRR